MHKTAEKVNIGHCQLQPARDIFGHARMYQVTEREMGA